MKVDGVGTRPGERLTGVTRDGEAAGGTEIISALAPTTSFLQSLVLKIPIYDSNYQDLFMTATTRGKATATPWLYYFIRSVASYAIVNCPSS